VKSQLDQGRKKIIVVSALVRHVEALYGLLHEALTGQVARMAGQHVESYLAKEAPGTRVVLASFALLEEGYDDPKLDTLVLTTPRSRVQQTVGRVERSHEGKLRARVIDIVDPFCVWPSMWYKRRAFYRSRGFRILDMK
jgi:superfamily II DNA or RNA helicase